MILAAADCAEGKGPPPDDLQKAWQVRDYGVLPNAGGLRDQRIGELERMVYLLNVYTAMTALHKSDDWMELQQERPELWAVISEVRQLRRRGA